MAASMEHGGGNDGSSSVSDSSDDEELQRLKEAAVTSAYPPVSKCSESRCTPVSATPQGHQPSTRLPSRRAVEENEDENKFGTTPQFRAFVAKKLAEKLDREIQFCVTEDPDSQHTDWANASKAQEDGVRLFSDSIHLVYAADVAPQMPQHKRPRRASTSSSDSSEDERLASAAVTEDFLIKERAMLAQLNPNTPDITVPQNGTTPAACGTHNDSSSHSIPKKKKKKKKRKNSEERLFPASEKSRDSKARESTYSPSRTVDKVLNKARVSVSVLASERRAGSESETISWCTGEGEAEIVKKKRKKNVDSSLSETNESVGSKLKTRTSCSNSEGQNGAAKTKSKETVGTSLSETNERVGSKLKTSMRCASEGEVEVVKKKKKNKVDICLSASNESVCSKSKTSTSHAKDGKNHLKTKRKKNAHIPL